MDERPEWTPDNLWVVAENQLGGWCACDSMDGYLMTFATQSEPQAEAEAIIEELNDVYNDVTDIGVIDIQEEHNFSPPYAPDSWAGVLLAEVSIGDNQNHIIMPLSRTALEPLKAISIEGWKQKFPDQRFD